MPTRRALAAAACLLLLTFAACAESRDTDVDRVAFDTADFDPDWSPDGEWIAFSSSRGGGGIFVIRPDSRGLRRVIRGDAREVDWSPNGRSLAFARDDGIYVIPARGGRARRLVGGESFSLPAWAPDGRRLAIVKEEADYSTAIYLVHAQGGRPHRLLPTYRGGLGDAQPGSIAARSETDPAWSPDGRSIAFQAADGYIVAAHIPGGRRRALINGVAYEPAWSPDGKLIAFQCEGDLCVTNADGSGDTHRLAEGGGDPSWAPDSRRLVFEHFLYGGSAYFSDPRSLSIVDVENGNVRRLTFGPQLPAKP